ncbi:MAG: ThiF family adenylyltransferase [Candidatus Helarchaeota archaeon]
MSQSQKTSEKKLYTRHSLLEGWDQDLIKNSTVFMVGVGALGCEIAKNLALVGIGNLILVDNDTIETSNLSRQMLFRPGDEGKPKAEVASRELKKFNPFMNVETHFCFLQDVPLDVYKKCDLIIGGLDNIKARMDLNKICIRLKKPLIDSGTLGFEGHVQIVIPEGVNGIPSTPCLKCLLPIPPADEKLIAACTPKGIPKKREHCVLKAEYEFGNKFNRKPDFDNDNDVEWLVEKSNKIAEKFKFEPNFKYDDMENILKNKMPAIQSVNAIVASIQSHEILKILHLIKGKNIGPLMNPPYINYNGVYGLFEYLDIGKDPNCTHCGEGKTEIIEVTIDKNEPIGSLFGLISSAIGSCDPNSCLISIDLTKRTIWNPFVDRLKDPNKTLSELQIQNGEILVFTRGKESTINILINYGE